MVRWSIPIKGLLTFCLTLSAFAQAPTTTFVQISVPDIREASPADVMDSARYVRDISALSAAVLEVNRLSLHQPIESVVVSCNTESMQQDPKAAADQLSGLLGGLSPGTIFLAFDSPASLDGKWFPAFLAELSSRLSKKTVIDLRLRPAPIHGISLDWINSVALQSTDPKQRDTELDRLGGVLKSGSPIILFATSTNRAAAVTSGDLWSLDGTDKTKWSALLRDNKLLALFVGMGPQTPGIFPTETSQKPDMGLLGERHIVYQLPTLEELYDQPGPSHGIMLVSMNADGRIETRPILLFNRFSEEQRDLQDELIQAGEYEKNEDYAAAYKKYGDALKSKDPDIRASADAGFHRVGAKLREPWERLQHDSIAVDWLARHGVDILGAVVLALIVSCWLYFRYRRLDIPVFWSPTKLNDDAPSDLFVLCIYREIKTIRDSWGAANSVRRTAIGLLALGGDAPDEVLEDLPKLIGESSASAVKLIFFFWRYFSWRVESSVYGTEENAAVYVKVCWGWLTRASWVIPEVGEEPMGIRECATKIAYNLSAEGLLKR